MSAFRMRAGLAVAAAMAIASFPSSALAQPVAPPGNSAVDQYTETLPIPGGGGPTAGNLERSPARVLGSRNARRLAALGPDGQAAAALAAAAAPIRRTADSQGANRTRAGRASGAKTTATGGAEAAQRGGSSGLSEIISQATGSSSSGEMGLLLPLLIGAVAASSMAYLWHRRRRGV